MSAPMSLWRYVVIVVRDELRAVADQARESKVLLLAFLACLVAIVVYLDPFPERDIHVATAFPGSDWHQFGELAVERLKPKGLRGTVVATSGAAENVDRLIDPRDPVNAAFAYGLALDDRQRKEIVSLGSLGYDPIWIFHRKDRIPVLESLSGLAGHRIGLGPTRSGSYVIGRKLLAVSGIEVEGNGELVPGEFLEGERRIVAGDVDAFLIVASVQEPIVQRLIRAGGIELFSFPNAAAFEKRFNSFDALRLPAGSLSIHPPVPARDVSLVATTTSVVVKKNMHPDLQLALLMAIKELNRDSEHLFFSRRNEFPAYVDPLVPISPVASKFYDYGPPAITRYLPFWFAGFFARAWVLLLTLVAVFYPLSRLNLHIRKLRFVIRERPHYEELLEIDALLCSRKLSEEEKEGLRKRLTEINQHASRAGVPVGEETHYFQLLTAITNLRRKIEIN